MHPVIVELYLETIVGIDRVVLIFLPDLLQDRRHVDARTKLDLVLGDKIIGEFIPERFQTVLMML